jgi:hypothetical protein
MHSSLFTSIRKLGLAVAALGFCFAVASAHAQIDPSSPAAVDWSRIANAGAPTAPCPTSTVKVGQPYTDTTNNINYTCGPSGWFQSSGSSGSGLPSCSDTSGSGTAQTCTTSPSFTPTGNQSCILYHTTTSNSGTGLTVNVNSAGAKSVAIAGASGWTTTLTSGVIPSAKPVAMCYDGTNWDVLQTGTAASSGGGGSYTNVVASATSDTTVAIINGKCTTGQVYLWSTAATMTAGGSINCPVIHGPGGSWTAGSALSVTFAGGLTELAPYIPTRAFGTNITAVFSAATETHAPVEWWGAVADWNGSTGTDNTTPIQACSTAHPVQCDILFGAYKITSALSFTLSSTGLHGSVMQFPTSGGSMIVQTTAGADIIDYGGTDASHPTYNNYFDHFIVKHSVAATGTAKGINASFTQSSEIAWVLSADSIDCFYFKNFQNSLIHDSFAQWSLSYTSGDIYGVVVDGASAPQSSQFARVTVNGLTAGGAGATLHGYYATGSNISDMFVDHLQVSSTNYGIEVIGTGGGGFHQSDIQFTSPVLNAITTSCAVFSNLAVADRGTGAQIIGGNCTPTGGTKAIDLETVQAIQIVGMQITPNTTTIPIYATTSSELTLDSDMITGAASTTGQIELNNVQGSTAKGGTIDWTGSGVAVKLTGGSTGNTISTALTGRTASATGITADSTSGNNDFRGTTYSGTITTAVVDSTASKTNQWSDSTATHANGYIINNVSSTNPVCPNGTGGALTTAGCSVAGGYPSAVTVTASASSSVTVASCISSSYRDYEIRISDVTVSNAGVNLQMQVSGDNGSTWDTTSAYESGGTYGGVGTTASGAISRVSSTTGFVLNGLAISNASTNSSFGARFTVFHPLGSNFKPMTGFVSVEQNADSTNYEVASGFVYRSFNTFNAFKIFTSAGTFSGTITCQPLPQ